MEFKEAVKIALQSLWANKLRSILTLLGVVDEAEAGDAGTVEEIGGKLGRLEPVGKALGIGRSGRGGRLVAWADADAAFLAA